MGVPQNPVLLPGCSYRGKVDGVCKVKRNTYKLLECYDSSVWTHESCICNEMYALANRHQIDTGYKCKDTVPELGEIWKPKMTLLNRYSRERVLSHYAGRQKKEYEKAYESLKGAGLSYKDAYVRMFLKDDKYFKAPKAPRCIQYRNKRYGLELARYTQPLEKYIYSMVDWSGTQIISKNRNLTQKGEDLYTKYTCFRNPVIVCADHSKFDAHVSVPLLKMEHDVYKSAFPKDRYLRQILNWQIHNKGFTNNNLMFKTKGTRMSGDQNTGLGNSVINYAILSHVFRRVKHLLYVDGDDSVIFMERDDLARVELKEFEEYGMETKVDMFYRFEDLEYCSSKPCFDGKYWKMVRDPRAALSKLGWSTRKQHTMDQKSTDNLLYSMGLCEWVLNNGIPVLGAIGKAMADKFAGRYIETGLHHNAMKEFIKPKAMLKHAYREPTADCRHSYFLSWGITPGQQIEMENMAVNYATASDFQSYLTLIDEWATRGM